MSKSTKNSQCKHNRQSTGLGLLFVHLVVACIALVGTYQVFLSSYIAQVGFDLALLSRISSLAPYAASKLPPLVISDMEVISGAINTLMWDEKSDAETLVQQVVSGSVPVLIKNGPAKSWPLTQANLLMMMRDNRHVSLSGVRWQTESVFVLGNERDKGGMLGSKSDRPLLYLNLSVAQFLDSIADPSEYLYWSGELSLFEESFNTSVTMASSGRSERKEALRDWSVFKVIDAAFGEELASAEADLWVPVVWLSHPGVVAQTHFDPQHNFLSQLQGSKRLLLFPPSEPNMYPFPHIHRSYRQSQLRLEAMPDGRPPLDPTAFPELPRAIEVVLRPGETLYIPPYWHHRVETLSPSLSLSTTSPASWEVAFSEMYWQQVPFGRFKDSSQGRQLAVKAYLQLLLAALPFEQSVAKFAQQVYASRYRYLFPSHILVDRRGAFTCAATPSPESSLKQSLDATGRDFEQASMKIANLMGAVDAPLQLKKSFTADYLEELSRWAVGPALTVFFIHDCLSTV